jgi:leucyl-tRNA synthetase
MVDPDTIAAKGAGASAADLRRKLHQSIRKVTEDYESFRFNTAVAALMELANAMQDYLAGGGARGPEWAEAVSAMIRLLNPMAPHIAEELWERTGGQGLCADAQWPDYDAITAAEHEVTLVVQVAGKVRDRLRVPAGLDEPAAIELALASEATRRALGNGDRPSRVVYVQDKLINLVP